MAAATSLIAAALCNSAACGGAQAIHFLQPHIVFSNQSARPPLPYSPDGFPTAPTAYFTSLLGDGTATMFGNLGHEHVGSNDTSGHWLFAESSTGGTSWSINARTPITSPITQNVLLPDPAACNGCWRNLGNLGIRPGNWAGESGWVYKGGYTVFKPTASGGIETVVPDAQSTVSFGGIPAPGMNTTANLLHYYPLVMSALRISSPSAAHPSVDPHNSTSHDGGKNTVLATAIVTLNDAPYNKGVGTFINPTSVAAFRSEDNGHSFHFVSYIAKQADFPWSTYGPTEHDCSLLADGKTLTCIIRMDADGPCTWSSLYVTYYQTWSRDLGSSWSTPVPVPNAGCVRPRLLLMRDGGPLVLSGGRFCSNGTTDILLWVNYHPDAAATHWVRHSVSDIHNRNWKGDSRYLFSKAINSTALFATDAYTSLVHSTEGGGIVYQKNYHPSNLADPNPSVVFYMPFEFLNSTNSTKPPPTLPPPAPPGPSTSPGVACATDGTGYKFFAQSWSDTCDCDGGAFPPQKRGDQCNWWTQPCGYCCKTCPTTTKDYSCVTLDNIRQIPLILDRYFGDNASHTASCIINGTDSDPSCGAPHMSTPLHGCSTLPAGHCTARFYDADLYIATEPADFVSLPEEETDCGDTFIPHSKHIANPNPASFGGPWWDTGATRLRAQSAKFFPYFLSKPNGRRFRYFKNIGGTLDGLYQDQEGDPTRQAMMKVEPLEAFWPTSRQNRTTWNKTVAMRCLRSRYTAIQNDRRFGPLLSMLKEQGFDAGPTQSSEWLADKMAPYSDTDNYVSQPPELNRQIWDAVMVERASLYWRDAFYVEAAKVFPAIKHANAGKHRWSASHCPIDEGGWAKCRAGGGATGYNVQNLLLYNEQPSFACSGAKKDPGCVSNPGVDVGLQTFFGVPAGAFRRSGFSLLVLQSNEFKGMALVAPNGTSVRPDVSDKSMSPNDRAEFLPGGPTDFYQERILHYGLMGTDEFIYFAPWSGFVYGTRAIAADHKLVSALLHQLDDMIGCDRRAWIRDESFRYTDEFVLTGMTVGRGGPAKTKNVWRVSLDSQPGSGAARSKIRRDNTSIYVSTRFDWGNVPGSSAHLSPLRMNTSIEFEAGEVLEEPSTPVSLAPAGAWIVQPSSCRWCVRLHCVDERCGPRSDLALPWPLQSGPAK